MLVVTLVILSPIVQLMPICVFWESIDSLIDSNVAFFYSARLAHDSYAPKFAILNGSSAN